jgi:hypothetical protein
MKKPDIHNLVSQLVGHKFSSENLPPRSFLKYLLPIDNAYGFYTSNKIEFYDPIQDQLFYRKFDVKNELTRRDAIDYINGRIDYYNRLWSQELGKNKKQNDHTYYIPQIKKWTLNLKLSSPILSNPKDSSRFVNKNTIRTLDNEYVYYISTKTEKKVFVSAFNKMIYIYLDSLRFGKKLIPENTLYNPIIEYQDWFMSSGIDIDKAESLLTIKLDRLKTEYPVAYNSNLKSELISAKYSIKVNPENPKWSSTPAESKIVNLIQNETLGSFIDDYKFDNINKINFKKLSLKLNCSDKTAKKIIEKHAPYLLDLE